MRSIRLAFTTLASALLSVAAVAGNGAPDAGSLLVFPLIDNAGDQLTLITVTNTNNNFVPLPNGILTGTVNVHFIYVNGEPGNFGFLCQESNSDKTLTPNDTITISSELQNPSWDRGYLYVYARNPATGAAISWNYLIGVSSQVSPNEYYELTPFVFKSGRGLADGVATDFSPADDIRNIDGAEYERVFDRIQVPHFFGEQDVVPAVGGGTLPLAQSSLVLINLSGAGQFTVVANFLLYNDSETQFSAQTTFRCWTKRRLKDINGMFGQTFLDSVSDNTEIYNGLESGWYRINGGTGSSGFDGLQDAAILAVQIGGYRGETTANLPFTSGLNPNEGELVSLDSVHP